MERGEIETKGKTVAILNNFRYTSVLGFTKESPGPPVKNLIREKE